MRTTRTWTTAAAVVLAGAVLVSLSPPEGTDARWRDSGSTTASGPRSDTFGMSASDVPDDRAIPWPTGRMATSPQVSLTNQSARQSSWVNVQSTRLDRAIANDGNAVLQKMGLDYTFGTGTCEAGGQGTYWQALAAGQVVDGATYRRGESKVSGATLAPGQPRVLCPRITLDYPATTAGQRSALLNHAGRAVDVSTVVNQRSEAPATWSSQPRTVKSRYRIAMPPPVKPSTSEVCRTTYSNGTPSPLGYYGGFFWGWPDADTTSATSTPAMAGGWEIMRRSRTGAWEVWKAVAADNVRELAGLNSRDVSDQRNEVREFTLRGYPFANDRSRYVESAWIVRAENDWSLLTDRWRCHDPLPNPDAGPHNLP